MADGVIVGSALVKVAGNDRTLAELRELGSELAQGCRTPAG